MSTITRRGEAQWQAKVRRRGYPTVSRTFQYKEEAERWARGLECELDTTGFVDRRETDRTMLQALLERYEREVTEHKKGRDNLSGLVTACAP